MSFLRISKTVLSAALLLFILAFADGDNLIQWGPDVKLTWADFQDKVPANTGIRVALTNSNIQLDFNQVSETTFSIVVNTAMDKSRSWVDKSKESDYILGHEQCHFDITEYGGRRMRKELATTKYTLKTIKDKITSIQKSNIKFVTDMQDEYDNDTKHSINKEQQKAWQEKVAKLLASLEDYANPNVTVMVKK